MTSLPKYFIFWWRWIIIVVIAVIIFGMGTVLAPGLIRQAFSLLIYSSSDHISTFGADAVAYISLVHAVLGAVMIGWGAALLYIVLGPFRRLDKEGWNLLAISIAAWFIPDTVFSLWSGFWQNAILNLVFCVLLLVPLAATYRVFHDKRT